MEEVDIPTHVVNQIWDFVDQFICPIQFIPKGDDRSPPGDHHGTGWFVEKNGVPHICTCEHVAIHQEKGTLGYAPFGGDSGVSVGSSFALEVHPLDFAIANLSKTWSVISHQGKCIPQGQISTVYQPVDGEFLYFQGFPGVDAKAGFGQQNVKGLGVFLHEVVPPEELFNEKPPFDKKMHICMAWSPANATPLTEHADVLSVPSGMSGSVLWDTGLKKAKDACRDWSTDDIKAVGIVWGASSKAGVITATPIEYFYNLLT
ncbi:TPA: hypothetical protein KDZ97_001594 [Vibrio parahaemolyticus]|nr:hypothetical protein [Vibrio alginolyticus]HBC3537105.1 hypothetical protein [Vibrio parahaemolyticus]HBC3816782.1 hypothetical protein [Vibrio parahaemolyticus]